MPLVPASSEATPRERLALYREQRVTHAVLLVPFDALSHLQQEAALLLAAEWGRDLAEVKEARRDIHHSPPEERVRPLVGLWVIRLLDGPIIQTDGEYWIDEAERWIAGEGTDPRLKAFCEAWDQAVPAHPAVPDPSPMCRCPACTKRWPRHKARRKPRR